MAKANHISGKRRRLFSPAVATLSPRVLARSGSKINVCENRSGQTRPSTAFHSVSRIHPGLPLSQKRKRESPQDLTTIRQSVKDLGSRRVFSPASISKEWRSEEDMGKKSRGEVTGSFVDADSVIRSCLSYIANECKEDSGFEDLSTKSGCNEIKSGASGNFLVSDSGGKACEEGDKRAETSDCEHQGDVVAYDDVLEACENRDVENCGSAKDCVQTTPPDSELFGDKIEVSARGSMRKINWSSETNFKSKMVLRPCSRLQLFKTQCSFSYKRLLPWLLEIAKESFGDSKKIPCLKKAEESMEAEPSSCHQGMAGDNGKKKCQNSSDGDRKELLNICTNMEMNSTGSLVPTSVKKSSALLAVEGHPEKCPDGDFKKFEAAPSDHQKFSNHNNVFSSDTENSQLDKETTTDMGTPGTDISATKMVNRKDIMETHVQNSAQNVSTISSNTEESSPVEETRLRGIDGNGILTYNEGQVGMTPPDLPAVLMKSEAKDDLHARARHVSRCADDRINKSLTLRSRGSIVDGKAESSSKNKSVQNPSPQRMLFKSPGSVNYKRLLPFFEGIMKDNSCGSSRGDKTHLPSVFPENEEQNIRNSDGTSHEALCLNTDDELQRLEMPIGAGSSCNHGEVLAPERVCETMGQNGLGEERENERKRTPSDAEKKLELSHESVDVRTEQSDFPMSIIGEATTPMKSTLEVANASEPEESNNLQARSLQPEASFSQGTSPITYRKGILRRNPRGCRGVCNCLNCSSFRLHADRAFEFSRNQMQDAEEMVFDLVEELSHLRGLLEQSALDSRHVLHASQVEEACRKASKAEELAKTRIQRMNDDLSIHCRVPSEQRPKVRFANYVHERVIFPRGPELDK